MKKNTKATPQSRKKKLKRAYPPNYIRDLNKWITFCFKLAKRRGWDNGTLATKAGLSTGCVGRLETAETRVPQFLTVWKMCTGLNVHQKYEADMSKYKGDTEEGGAAAKGPMPSPVLIGG